MKIIDAVWEIRNLGLETKEIVIEEKDPYEEIREQLNSISAEYVVIKVPALRMDLNILLGELGYTYVETMVRVSQDVRNLPAISEEEESRVNRTRFIPMDNSGFEKMITEIQNGLFRTDRIGIDPYFTRAIANRRYVGWIRDAKKNGAVTWTLLLDNVPIGFYVARAGDYNTIVSGLYSEFQGKGLGNCLARRISLEYKMLGIFTYESDVSTNNIPSLKRNLKNGYRIEKFTYIFMKHNLNKEVYLERLRSLGILQENGELSPLK